MLCNFLWHAESYHNERQNLLSDPGTQQLRFFQRLGSLFQQPLYRAHRICKYLGLKFLGNLNVEKNTTMGVSWGAGPGVKEARF